MRANLGYRMTAPSRELREWTDLIVAPESWRFVRAMHRRTDRTIVNLLEFIGRPRIFEPEKCDCQQFSPLDALLQVLAGRRTAMSPAQVRPK